MLSSTEQTPLCSRTDHCENLDINFLLHTETWWLHWWRVLNESFALEDKVQKQFQEASRLDAACFEDKEWLQKVASLLFQLIHAMIMAAERLVSNIILCVNYLEFKWQLKKNPAEQVSTKPEENVFASHDLIREL